MEDREIRFHSMPDDAVTCDVCGEAINIGDDYVSIAAEDESGTTIGSLIAHPECADRLDPDDIPSLLNAATGMDAEELDDVLPLDRCCLCGDAIDDHDYINLIEPMHPGEPGSILVATTFHLACYREDPDGVQRALDDEILKQRTRRLREADNL